MRFCMVTTFYPPYHFGGDAIFVRALSRALVEEGHSVEVVHCEDSYRLWEKSARVEPGYDKDITVHRLCNPLGFLSPLLTQQTGRPGLKARALRAIFDREFDVVNFHNISLVGGPGILGMSKARVNLYTLHEHWLLCPAHIFWKNRVQACDTPQCIQCSLRSGIPPQLWRYTGLIERSLEKVDAILSPSEYTASQHKNIAKTPPIHVLPTFSSLVGDIHSKTSSPSGRPCFLYVGRVTASKGIVTLLKEFSKLRDYDLLIVGGGDLHLTLQQEYAKYAHIRFLGSLPQHQLSTLYQKATALVLPSIAPEVFPLTILEAFAHGTPAVVHNAGGSREAIDKTGGGFVYKSREELHQALSKLAEDSHVRASMGERARLGYERFYSRRRYLDRYLELIETIGKEKRSVVRSLKNGEPTMSQEKDKNLEKPGQEPSGPRGFPILGHIPQFLWDRLGFLSRCATEYGDVVKLKIGERTFLLNNPEDIKHVLVMNSENYDKGPRLTSPKGKRLSGEGLLTSLGPVHLKQRKMMQPAFYRTSIKTFAETITDGVEQRLARWKSGVELNIGDEMMALAQRNIIRTVLGQDFVDSSGELARSITIRKKYVEHVYFSLLPFPEYFPFWLARKYHKAMMVIDDNIYRGIQKRRDAADPGQDMLSLLMHTTYEDGTGMTDNQIRDEFLTLFSAGYETVGEALTWTWYLLVQNPTVETKFLEELGEVLGGRTPTVEDLPKLRYTAMVFAESMRLYPPTWLFVRMARQDDILPSGFRIPAGSKIYLCQYLMHRNARYWPNPERFDPERFTEEAKKERPTFAYFPFGGGVRMCIGEAFAKMEGVLALASIAQRFAFRLIPGQNLVPKPHMTLRPKNGIRMRIQQRNACKFIPPVPG